MPKHLFRIDEVIGQGHYLLRSRGERRELTGLSFKHPPAVGDLVIVDEDRGNWRNPFKALTATWPKEYPRCTISDATSATTHNLLIEPGHEQPRFCVDANGDPCELRAVRLDDGRSANAINYSGWLLLEYLQREAPVVVLNASDGPVVLLGPDVASPRDLQPRSMRGIPGAPGELATPAPAASSRDFILQADEVEWHNEFITLDLPGVRKAKADHPQARQVFEPLKSDLAAFLGEPLKFTVLPSGELLVDIPGRIAAFVKEVSVVRRRNAIEAAHRDGFRKVTDLVREALESPSKDEDVFDIPELEMTGRDGALRLLFGLRDRSLDAWLWAREAMLIPIPAGEGPPIWCWEVVKPGHATYLFRPDGPTSFERLKDVLRDIHTRRGEVRGTSLGRELGFLKRVLHLDEDRDLSRWRKELEAAIKAFRQ